MAVSEREEELRREKRQEDKFRSLLDEYFYRSDQLGTSWEEAKKLLERRSAYDAVSKAERRRLFSEHIEDLARRMEAKTKSMQTILDAANPSLGIPIATQAKETAEVNSGENGGNGGDEMSGADSEGSESATDDDSVVDKTAPSRKRERDDDGKDRKHKKQKKEKKSKKVK